jgi:hypothetical protein
VGGVFGGCAVEEEPRQPVVEVVPTGAEQRPRVPFGGREQAIAELAIGREPEPVAAIAEGMRDRVDETDQAPVGSTHDPAFEKAHCPAQFSALGAANQPTK